jgi:hypothetical protein
LVLLKSIQYEPQVGGKRLDFTSPIYRQSEVGSWGPKQRMSTVKTKVTFRNVWIADDEEVFVGL